jgi:3-oxoacyl-[acyl-carrier-protein] synthase-3
MKAVIKSIASYLPKQKLTNEMLAKAFPEWSVKKISAKIGINQRSISGAESVSSMAIKAAKRLFSTSPLKPENVDFILLCTQSPDHFLPTTACIIQRELGVPTTAGALDFNQGCSGYVYGLSLAKGLIYGGIAKNILLLTSEAYTKYIHPEDKSNKAIFGDAATASWIGLEDGLEIGNFVLGSDGNGAGNLIVQNGGSLSPVCKVKSKENDKPFTRSNDHLYMNGSEIFNFTLEEIPRLVNSTITSNNLLMDNIDWFVFHQANAFMLEHLRLKVGIMQEKFPIYMEHTGNTVSSTIPIVLENMISINNICAGDKILLAGFGVGYSWGGVVLSNSLY